MRSSVKRSPPHSVEFAVKVRHTTRTCCGFQVVVGCSTYHEHMVSTDLLASVAALSEAERIELVGYIEQTLDTRVSPTPEQQMLVEQRVADLKADPGLGLSKDEAIAAARALLA